MKVSFWSRPLLRKGSAEHTKLMEALEQWAPHMLEEARKMSDFRPKTCERCRQLDWERFAFEGLLYRLELLFGDPNSLLPWWAQGVDLGNQFEQHLLHERHVFALLPPAEEGAKRG